MQKSTLLNQSENMAFTKLNLELNFLKNIHFDHEYFEFGDSNDIRLVYANNDINYNCRGIGENIKSNTMTIFAPGATRSAEKLELGGLMLKDVNFDCVPPKTTQGTMMCDALLEFVPKSKLMNGNLEIKMNDALPISLNNLDTLTIFVDPTGNLEFIFDR